VDLVWKKGEQHGGTNEDPIEYAYVPHVHVHEFLEGEWGDLHTPVKWNIFKNVLAQKNIKNATIRHHLGHTW
jgi:hypothetical protein